MNAPIIAYRANMGVQTTAPFANTYSLSFDGVDDRVQLASDFVASGEFTISFWMKPTTISGNGSPYVIGRFPLLFNNYIKLDQLGRINILINQTLVSFFEGVTGGGANNIVLNEWQNIIITRDSSNGLRCYRNGAVFGYNGSPITNSSPLTLNSIGRNYSNTYGYNGALDEIAFWNTDETANLSTISTAPTVDLTSLNPTQWYRMGDNGSWKSPQWLIPSDENKDKVSNYSFELDGIDDYVNIPNNTELNFSSAYSVSFWINTTSSALLSPISNQSKFLIRLYAPANQIRLQLYDGSNGFLNLDNTQVFNDGNWHHIAFTTEATTTTDKVIVYFDGVALANKGTQLNIGSHLSAFAYEIGRNSGTWNFNGGIDEVSIYDSELSASEINDIYNGGEPNTISGAVAHYKMGEEANFTSNWLVDNSALDNYSKRSFEFDGIDDKVELGTQSLGITGAISVSAWVKIPTTNTGGAAPYIQHIVCEDRTFGTSRNWGLFWRGGTNLNGFSAFIYDSSGVYTPVNSATPTPNDNQWHHLMFTYTGDTTTNGLKLFVDGVQIAQSTSSNGGLRATTTVIPTIGSLSNGVGRMFEGNIDEVSIFNTVVDISDVWDGSGEPIDVSSVSGIVSNYRMGEDASFNGTNWTVPDNVGSNNGTSANMTVDDLVGEAPNYSGGGISSGMTIEDRVGEAPNSTNNALSFNMESVDRTTDVPT